MAGPKKDQGSFVVQNILQPEDSYAAFSAVLFRNGLLLPWSKPLPWLGLSFHLSLPHTRCHPILLEWFSFAVAKNTLFAVDQDRDVLGIECRFLIPIFDTPHSYTSNTIRRVL